MQKTVLSSLLLLITLASAYAQKPVFICHRANTSIIARPPGGYIYSIGRAVSTGTLNGVSSRVITAHSKGSLSGKWQHCLSSCGASSSNWEDLPALNGKYFVLEGSYSEEVRFLPNGTEHTAGAGTTRPTLTVRASNDDTGIGTLRASTDFDADDLSDQEATLTVNIVPLQKPVMDVTQGITAIDFTAGDDSPAVDVSAIGVVSDAQFALYGNESNLRVITAFSSGSLAGKWQWREYSSAPWCDIPPLSGNYFVLWYYSQIRFLPKGAENTEGTSVVKPSITLKGINRNRTHTSIDYEEIYPPSHFEEYVLTDESITVSVTIAAAPPTPLYPQNPFFTQQVTSTTIIARPPEGDYSSQIGSAIKIRTSNIVNDRVITAHSKGSLSGKWQYCLSNCGASGSGWTDMPDLDGKYFVAPSYIRFLPEGNEHTEGSGAIKPTLTVRATNDRTGVGTLRDPTDFDADDLSDSEATLTVTIVPLQRPVMDATQGTTAISFTTADNPPSVKVSDIGEVSDTEGAFSYISTPYRAITAYSSGSLGGKWQWRWGRRPWEDIPSLNGNYFVFGSSGEIRFLPKGTENTEDASVIKPSITLKGINRERTHAFIRHGGIHPPTHFEEYVLTDESITVSVTITVAPATPPTPPPNSPNSEIAAIKTRNNNQSDSLARHEDEIGALESSQSTQDTDIDALEASQATQDEKIADLEAKVNKLEGSTTTIYNVPSAKNSENIRPYPNPTTQRLQFAGLSATFRYTYKIYASTGILLLSGTLHKDETIDMSSLAQGQYLVTLHTEEGEEVLHSSLVVK